MGGSAVVFSSHSIPSYLALRVAPEARPELEAYSIPLRQDPARSVWLPKRGNPSKTCHFFCHRLVTSEATVSTRTPAVAGLAHVRRHEPEPRPLWRVPAASMAVAAPASVPLRRAVSFSPNFLDVSSQGSEGLTSKCVPPLQPPDQASSHDASHPRTSCLRGRSPTLEKVHRDRVTSSTLRAQLWPGIPFFVPVGFEWLAYVASNGQTPLSPLQTEAANLFVSPASSFLLLLPLSKTTRARRIAQRQRGIPKRRWPFKPGGSHGI